MKESEKLSNFLADARSIKSQYEFSNNKINEMDQLQCDLLHKLEFKAKTAAERNKVSTALKKCRLERRKYKETAELSKELAEFIDLNQPLVKRLEKILGNMRKIEENQDKRSYKPRVLTDEEWERS